MPLPEDSVVLSNGESSRHPKHAFLIRLPEDAWTGIQESAKDGGEVSISLDGIMVRSSTSVSKSDLPPKTLNIPNHTSLPLEPLPAGTSSEIHFLSPAPHAALSLQAVATTKLAVPMSSVSSARAANKLRSQNEVIDKERQERANRVNGVSKGKSIQSVVNMTPVGMTTSRPIVENGVGTGTGGIVIPLKTRVVQLLALGPATTADIVRKVGGLEQDVMRVVNVVSVQQGVLQFEALTSDQVARQQQTGSWNLQPTQYSKVKVNFRNYTYAEKLRVVRLAQKAFDELCLSPDADERIELDKKEAEMMNGASPSSNEEKALVQTTEPLPTPPKVVCVTPAPNTASKRKAPQTIIGKQMAKFAKDKRASSMPNVKRAAVTVQVRAERKSTSPGSKAIQKVSPIEEKRKREDTRKGEEERNRKRKREISKTKESPIYTSSESGSGSKKRRSLSYSSSEDEPLRGRSPVQIIAKRKSPPPELKLNGHQHAQTPRDPEVMRDRYEELYPAYEQLTRKLIRIHCVAEDDGTVDAEREEVERMVGKWKKWHVELTAIRACFGED